MQRLTAVNMMKSSFNRVREYCRYLLHSWSIGSTSLGRLGAALRLPFGAAVVQKTGLVEFSQLGISVPKWASERLLRGYWRLVGLKERFPQSFAVNIHGDQVHLTVDGITLLVRTWGDVDVMHEILVRELYHFQPNGPCVVWDVGMNVGMASLYFAAMPEVVAVHGYELFRPTWEQAGLNFALNPSHQSKIKSHSFGLGARSLVLELPYHEDLKGIVGLDGPLAVHEGVVMRQEWVQVMPATEALSALIAQHPQLPVILKMDCEGAEGEILEDLETSKSMRNLSIIIMEWHGSDMRRRVESLLKRNGFLSVSQPFEGADVGALTAFRAGAFF